MALTVEQIFDRNFEVHPYPKPAKGILLTDRVHESASPLAESLGLLPVDVTQMDIVDALQEIKRQRVSVVLGRGEFDKAIKRHPHGKDIFWKFRDSPNFIEMLVRLGNGVGMDVQQAFDDGILVVRTPRGNAESVRIWQDLMLLDMHFGFMDGNPAAQDNRLVKDEGSTEPFKWDRSEVTSAVMDPESEKAKRCAEVYRGKKVAVIGGGGIIGREVIANSVFLKEADVHVFDPGLDGQNGEGFKVSASIEDALQDAELVLLHNAGDNEILGEKELALLKRGARVCNVSRGGCINPRALYEAIESGQVGGAGLDVHTAEKKEVAKYVDVPLDFGERQPGHWAVLLRNHPRVCATNHSAASEAQAEKINAEDAVRAVHAHMTRGKIANALAVKSIGFPYDAYVDERDDGGFSPVKLKGPRVAMEVLHDGAVPGLIVKMRAGLGAVLGGDVQIVYNLLRNKAVEDRTNGVEVSAFDLPPECEPNAKLFAALARRAESEKGIRRVKFFRVDPKRGA